MDTKKHSFLKNRILDINKNAKVNVYDCFYTDNLNEKIFKNKKVDYVIDAIDTMKSKIELIKYCFKNNLKIITSLGAGNRLDASCLKVCDISEIESFNCNFLKNVIRILKKEGIEKDLPVCYSCEKPQKACATIIKSKIEYCDAENKKMKSAKFLRVQPHLLWRLQVI
ncbi:MAG: ThiF family adenylyltransferase [Candidatus Melainabacteria bacterium]|nr:MAG: ThiF family adenylyltransferase [Candidatus Melainabacteria bacterium]